MEYIKEDEILLSEELRAKNFDGEDLINKATIRFRENVRLANSVCSKISDPRDPSIDRDDILQTGYEGLWKACLQFDESKGFAFSTYAVPMIKGQVLRMLRDTGNLKVPRHYKDIRAALARHGFTVPLTDEEIDILVSEGKVSRKQIMDYAEPVVMSLDESIKDGEEVTLSSIIPDTRSLIPEDLSEDDIEKAIDMVLKYVKPIHRDLVEEWMYATMEGVTLTQNELGIKYGLSRVQVSRILKYSIYIVKMHGDEIRNIFGRQGVSYTPYSELINVTGK